ncbi:hypothetical protein LINPERPRIM_LOCUS701, partial [Linum perenne]
YTFSVNRLYRSSAKTNQQFYFHVNLRGRHLGTDGQTRSTASLLTVRCPWLSLHSYTIYSKSLLTKISIVFNCPMT